MKGNAIFLVYLNRRHSQRERERMKDRNEKIGHGNEIAEIDGLFIWNAIVGMRRVIAHQCSVRFVHIFR